MAQGRKGKTAYSKLALLLLGSVGTHKSELALETMRLKTKEGKPFRVLYIDVENGSVDDRIGRFERDYGVDGDNLYILYTQSLEEVLEYVNKCKENEDLYVLDENGDETDEIVTDADGNPFRADAIVIDGMKLLTEANKMTLLEVASDRADVRIAEKKIIGKKADVLKGNIKLEPTDYAIMNNNGVKLILSLVGSGKHFVVTSFAKDDTVEDETGAKDSFGNVKKIKTGKLIPDAFKGCAEYCKTVITLSADDFGEISAFVQDKDRTETFATGSVIKDFSLTMFQPVIDKSSNASVIKCNLDESIKKDASKIISKDAPKEVKLSDKVSIREEDLIKDLQTKAMSLLAGNATERKAKISMLKEHGLTNPRTETNIDKLKQTIELLENN